MFAPNDFPTHISDRLFAAASALVLTGVLMATAILPASTGSASSILAIGVLA
ncbi:MAG: hypothetical protein WBA51_12440 [Erythrobacter sp.]